MKTLLFTTIVLLLTFTANSQITATTSSGKKVILSMDGTWKYADGEVVVEKNCQKNHTGNLTVKNATDTTIYFYYTRYEGTTQREFIKLRPKSSKTINDLESSAQNISYHWLATYELQHINAPWYAISGIGKGSFVIVECEVAEIEVE